jgi:RNA polymerase sigma-54 factor
MTRLVLTPMLQQAITMLGLSAVELRELLQRELQDNLTLEEAPPEDTPEADAELGVAPDELGLTAQEEDEQISLARLARTPTSLADHLREQLHLSVVSPAIRGAAEDIIGNLDDDGYLCATVQEIAGQRALPVAVVESALRVVQGLDPPGVAARDLRECLLIQLREPDRRHPAEPLAIEILERHFEALQRGHDADIAGALHVTPERVKAAVRQIASLEPRPGRSFVPVETQYVVPDVAVEEVGDDFVVVVNDEGIPRLRLNPGYRSMLGRDKEDGARRYVEDRLRAAVWLIKSVHQRQRTLYQVTRSIVRFQREFLDKGLSHLRPLSLRDVAEDVGFHESTVRRVITGKFVHTPQGTLPLRFLLTVGFDDPPGRDDPPDPGPPDPPDPGPPAPAAAAGAPGIGFDRTEADGRRPRVPGPRIVRVHARGR